MTYGVDKAGEALNSSYGKVLQTKVDDLVKVADNYVDYYLPANPGMTAAYSCICMNINREQGVLLPILRYS